MDNIAGTTVQYVHVHVFRDLKPGNVLLELKKKTKDINWATVGVNEVIVKVADLGESRKIGSDSTMTKERGTRGYMAPEVKNSGEYNDKADVFSIGGIAYNMKTNSKLDEEIESSGEQIMRRREICCQKLYSRNLCNGHGVLLD